MNIKLNHLFLLFLFFSCSNNLEDEKENINNNLEFKKNILYGNLSLNIPLEFITMSSEDKNLKYGRGIPPEYVYTNPQGDMDISLKYTNSSIKKNIFEFDKKVQKDLDAINVKWISKGHKTNNEDQRLLYEYRIHSNGDEIYNYMCVMNLDSKILIVTFNCLEKDKKKWKKVGKKIINEIEILKKDGNVLESLNMRDKTKRDNK